MADYVKQQCEGMLCHGIEAVLRHVADRYALFFCISYIDMVEASASRDNQFQARKMVDDLLIDLGVDESLDDLDPRVCHLDYLVFGRYVPVYLDVMVLAQVANGRLVSWLHLGEQDFHDSTGL